MPTGGVISHRAKPNRHILCGVSNFNMFLLRVAATCDRMGSDQRSPSAAAKPARRCGVSRLLANSYEGPADPGAAVQGGREQQSVVPACLSHEPAQAHR